MQAAQLHTTVQSVLKLGDSLRSSLCKIALMTINDMFAYLKRCMEPDLDHITKLLLKKAADTNIFISEEADKALAQMCTNCQESKVLSCLLMQNTKSNSMRLKVCICLETLVKALGNNILFFKDNDKLICQLAVFLTDAS